MKIEAMKMFGVILVLSAISITSVNGQDRNDVIKAYNEGAKAVQTDLPVAIKSFEDVITLSGQAGESAADLKEKAIKVLPGLYAKLAYNALNEKKPAQVIIQAAKNAVAASEKYDSPSNKDNAEKILVQAYNIMAADYFSRNDYAGALITYDSLLAINPDYISAIYNKALIYVRQDSSNAFEKTIDSFIEKTKSRNEADKVKQASVMALEYFRAAGSKANQANNLDEALVLLNKAAKYGDDKDLFYYFSDVYNKQKNFDLGAEYAGKGLALESGDAVAKAKFYFQMGIAQQGKGQTSDACASFKNAMYGPFLQAAKTSRANLKCE